MMDSPKKLGYRMPAEYEPHHGTLMIWPTRPGSWPFEGKAAKAALQKVVENRHALIVLTPEVDDIVALSVNNLNEHHALFVGQLNTYDVLVNDDVVFSATALENFLRKEEN